MKDTFHLHPIRSMLAVYLLAVAGILIAFTSQPAQASAPAPDQSTSNYEVRFMQEMIEHHTMAVHMANMCLAKAVHQELRAMCQDMITEQQSEISMMQQWLSAWYGISNYQPMMNPGMHNRMEKLAMLNNAEFEIEFMQEMIRHHKMAVVKASQCVDRAYHPELQDMCADMITSQLSEIRQMQEWLCTWYGLCRPRHQR